MIIFLPCSFERQCWAIGTVAKMAIKGNIWRFRQGMCWIAIHGLFEFSLNLVWSSLNLEWSPPNLEGCSQSLKVELSYNSMLSRHRRYTASYFIYDPASGLWHLTNKRQQNSLIQWTSGDCYNVKMMFSTNSYAFKPSQLIFHGYNVHFQRGRIVYGMSDIRFKSQFWGSLIQILLSQTGYRHFGFSGYSEWICSNVESCWS